MNGVTVKPIHNLESYEALALLERIALSLELISGSAGSVNRLPATSAELPGWNNNVIRLVDSSSKTRNSAAVNENQAAVIENFLEKRNVGIRSIPPEDAADSTLNSLAEFMGNNYQGLRNFLLHIKRNMQLGAQINLSLKEYPQKDICNICQFATRLYKIAFLEEYRYFKSPQYLLRAKTTTLPVAQNFLSGKWLERFVLLSTQKAVNAASAKLNKKLDFSYLANPLVTLPNGDDFELDLIFQVNGVNYWIEAKSGDYQKHISKYSRISKILGLDSKHSMMVVTDIPSTQSSALSALHTISVLKMSELRERLVETITAES